MSTQGSKNSPKSSPKPRKQYNPPLTAKRIHPIEHSKLLLAPKPYKKDSLNKSASKPGINHQVVKSKIMPQKESYGSKPAVPPKPRNVVVKRGNSAKFKAQKNKEDNNDSGLSGNFSIFYLLLNCVSSLQLYIPSIRLLG